MFYKDTIKEKSDFLLLLVTSIIPTIFLMINFLSIYYLLVYYDLSTQLNNYALIVVQIAMIFINYKIFVKEKEFLNYNFEKNKLHGFYIVSSLILTFLIFIFIANIYRNKTFKQISNNDFVCDLKYTDDDYLGTDINSKLKLNRYPKNIGIWSI